MSRLLHVSLPFALAFAACAPSLPPRGVLEQGLGQYTFRRYQKSMDAEIPVEGNPATAHLGTYVKGHHDVSVVPVTVTEYTRAEGLVEAIRTVLRGMSGYEYGVRQSHGEWLWTLSGELEDAWLLWPHGRYLLKIGVPEGEGEVPEAVLSAYLKRYPSDLNAQGMTEE